MTKKEALAKLFSGEATKIKYTNCSPNVFLEITDKLLVDGDGYECSFLGDLEIDCWQALVVKEEWIS